MYCMLYDAMNGVWVAHFLLVVYEHLHTELS